MIAQFQTPTVMLKSYSGDRLNVVAQLPMILGHGDQEVLSVVLIQKDDHRTYSLELTYSQHWVTC